MFRTVAYITIFAFLVYIQLNFSVYFSGLRVLAYGTQIAPEVADLAHQITNDNKAGGAAADATFLPTIDLPPGTTSIILNIGANVDPILPPISAGPCAISIVFEPLVYSQIEYHPQIFVIPAAVSSTRAGMATMYDYGTLSVSSSLSQAARAAPWNNGKRGGQGGGRAVIVPILKLSEVLEVIPRHLPISHILTDVQGHDFDLIRSGIALIRARNVTTLKTEVFVDQKSSFDNAENDLCLHWLPLMTEHGYVLEKLHPPREKYGSHEEAVATCREQLKDFYKNRNGTIIKKMKEWDALWRLDTIKEPLGVEYYDQFKQYLPSGHRGRSQMEHLFPNFTESEYAQCYAVPK
jgi:hypothetical protein